MYATVLKFNIMKNRDFSGCQNTLRHLRVWSEIESSHKEVVFEEGAPSAQIREKIFYRSRIWSARRNIEPRGARLNVVQAFGALR